MVNKDSKELQDSKVIEVIKELLENKGSKDTKDQLVQMEIKVSKDLPVIKVSKAQPA